MSDSSPLPQPDGVPVALVVFLLLFSGTPTRSQAPPPSADDGVGDSVVDGAATGFYSLAQAERGSALFEEACSECHTLSEFRGPDFEWRWRRQTGWDLFREISTTMPEDRPGELEATSYGAIVAYLLSLNDYVAGEAELESSEEALSQVPLGAGAAKSPRPVD